MRRKSLDQIKSQVDKDKKKTSKQRQSARQREDRRYREVVLVLRGPVCRSCGSTRDVQVDHLVGRVGEARLAVENGTPLCGDFGDGRCHPRKTANQLLIQRGWLDPDQVEWLAKRGYVVWDDDGSVSGRNHRIFADACE